MSLQPLSLEDLMQPMPGPDYEPLMRVLHLAFDQAAAGKGKERHACGEGFMSQGIMERTKHHGVGSATSQVEKKARETIRLIELGRPDAAKAELLGAIVYAAAAWLAVEDEYDA
jgi:hypothetical protein